MIEAREFTDLFGAAEPASGNPKHNLEGLPRQNIFGSEDELKTSPKVR